MASFSIAARTNRFKEQFFNLPEETAKRLLSKPLPPGNTLTKITKLPALHDNVASTDNYGRFFNRSLRGGSSRDQRGGYGGGGSTSRGWGGRSGGGHFSDREDDEFRRGGRSSSGSGSSWSRNSRSSSGDDWSRITGDRRSSRTPSFGTRDR